MGKYCIRNKKELIIGGVLIIFIAMSIGAYLGAIGWDLHPQGNLSDAFIVGFNYTMLVVSLVVGLIWITRHSFDSKASQ